MISHHAPLGRVVPERTARRAPVARAEKVAYRYLDRAGLGPVSLVTCPGEAVLVAGPSGCGKSTLARCLTGLIPHLYRGELSGRVEVEGLDTRKTPLWRLAEKSGLVFQNPASQILTSRVEQEVVFGLENLGLPPAEIQERLESALSQFGLQALRGRSPQSLSGGEQQRLALAAVTARRPTVLVLDEPLSMLDSTAAASLVSYLSDLCSAAQGDQACDRPLAVIVCEHRTELLSQVPGLRTIYLDGVEGDRAVPAVRAKSRASAVGYPVAPQPPFRLQVSGLSVQLGGRHVLKDFSFSAPGGQILAVVGRNGVGKTTLLRALADLQKHSGRAFVDQTGESSGQRPRLGMVFQNPDLQLFNPTVRQEILYCGPRCAGAEPDMARYGWLIDALGLENYEETSPLLLSEGEKKRVALATVLMRDHAHGVLLDEPTLGQDDHHRAMLVRLARALADAGQLVVLSTHDLLLAACADRLMLLGSDGVGRAYIVADGLPARVLGDAGAWSDAGLLVPDWVRARPVSSNECSLSISAVLT